MEIEDNIDVLMNGKPEEVDGLLNKLRKMVQQDPSIEHRRQKKERMAKKMKLIESYV